MSLLKYWPSERNCLDCIKPEAENPSDAVFLAVHQSMRFQRYSFSTKHQELRTDQQLLEELLKDDPSGRVIMPILGESGIGKSHLVRWLDVQLRMRKDSASRHVIRIPKSSSLKSVLSRILEGLTGPHYEEIRSQLQAARDQMDDISARHRVRAELLAAIERKYKAAKERKSHIVTNGGVLTREEELWLGHGDERALRALFSDSATERLFFEGTPNRPGIISELASHLIKDRHTTRRQFEQLDFDVPATLQSVIDRDAGPVAKRYLMRLNRTNDRDREDAVMLLNRIVDDAIRPLATPSDMSLAELFYEIRRQLLAEGRELVLLVEDFAVLAGIQRSLLDAMIREGESGGRSEACMIRSVLAVTEGYFKELDTVQTRAVYGWRLETVPQDDETTTFQRIITFIAAYLNAARIGSNRLEEYYRSSLGKPYERPQAADYLAQGEEGEMLHAFGQSSEGLELFPFNEEVIIQLADKRMRTQEGKLRFHPRSIINEIILPLVKNYRTDFERGEFPPEEFMGFSESDVSLDLAHELSGIEPDAVKRKRLLYLLRFWGGNPHRVADASLSSDVYRAFKLPVLAATPKKKQPKTANKPTVATPTRPAEPTVTQGEPIQIVTLVNSLNLWREGNTLPQAEANKVRKIVLDCMLNAIEWEKILLKPRKDPLENNAIYLPNAQGRGAYSPDNCFLCVASDEEFQASDVRNKVVATLRAIVRFDHYKNWNYDGAEIDYCWFVNFLDMHRERATRWIQDRYRNVNGNPVPALVQALLWQARILNVPEAHSAELSPLVAAVFCRDVPGRNHDDDQEWGQFIDECRRVRPLLLNQLYERVTAWQGTGGNIPYAVDVSQLLEPIRTLKQGWKISAEYPRLASTAPDDLRLAYEHVRKVATQGVRYVSNRRANILARSKVILAQLGEAFDQADLLTKLKEVVILSQKHGVTGQTNAASVTNVIERVQSARTAEVLQQVRVIEKDNEGGAMMSAIAKLEIETHSLLVEFSQTCADFVKERMDGATTLVGNWTDALLKNTVRDTEAILLELEATATRFVEDATC